MSRTIEEWVQYAKEQQNTGNWTDLYLDSTRKAKNHPILLKFFIHKRTGKKVIVFEVVEHMKCLNKLEREKLDRQVYEFYKAGRDLIEKGAIDVVDLPIMSKIKPIYSKTVVENATVGFISLDSINGVRPYRRTGMSLLSFKTSYMPWQPV